MDIAISCASGVEKVLKSELNRLGYKDIPAENGSFRFETDFEGVCKCNINLRTAERVYIVVARFNAETFDQLFDGVKSVRWQDYVKKDADIVVNGNCVKSKLFAISACQKIVDKAITQKLMEEYRLNFLPESGERVEINFYIYKDVAEIRINTSGAGLHKRGYRDLVGIAPIKETLASAILLLSDFYYKYPLCDPFCGSGTFLIEGAMIALNIAPNLNRKFAFSSLKIFDKKIYERAIEQAKDLEQRQRKLEIFGSDIDKKAVSLSLHHAENAGVREYINIKRADVKDFSSQLKDGTIVTNPPYGERVYDLKEAETCYKSLRDMYDRLDNWSLFLITSHKRFEKVFGKNADRVRKLYNSEKECNLYYYYKKKGE